MRNFSLGTSATLAYIQNDVERKLKIVGRKHNKVGGDFPLIELQFGVIFIRKRFSRSAEVIPKKALIRSSHQRR